MRCHRDVRVRGRRTCSAWSTRCCPPSDATRIVIDCSTVSADTARAAAHRLRERGADFLDAPVSGGVEGARDGTLAIMVGGDAAGVRARASRCSKPWAARHSLRCERLPARPPRPPIRSCAPASSRRSPKQWPSPKSQDLPLDKLIETLGKGAGSSWYFVNRAPNIVRDSYPAGFRVRLHEKDLKICRAMAARHGVQLPLIEMTLVHYRRLIEQGHGDEDISTLFRLKDALFAAARGRIPKLRRRNRRPKRRDVRDRSPTCRGAATRTASSPISVRPRAVLAVVLIVELVAIIFAIARQALHENFWIDLAGCSLFLLWIGLGLRGCVVPQRGLACKACRPHAPRSIAIALLVATSSASSRSSCIRSARAWSAGHRRGERCCFPPIMRASCCAISQSVSSSVRSRCATSTSAPNGSAASRWKHWRASARCRHASGRTSCSTA